MQEAPGAESQIYRFTVTPREGRDPRSAGLLHDARALGMGKITNLECSDLYFIEGQICPGDFERIAHELLSDPIAQTVEWGRLISEEARRASPRSIEDRIGNRPHIIEVALRPGVTDPVAEQIVRACKEVGIAGVRRASTGQRYQVSGQNVDGAVLHQLARRLLANAVIQRYALDEVEPVFPQAAQASGQVEIIPVCEQDEAGLLEISRQRRAALDLREMQAIQAYYRQQDREPTDIEFEMIAQTWSEHCVHKTFKARIAVQDDRAGQHHEINGLLNHYIRGASEQINAPWVLSAFQDNAGIIDFDDEYEISFKVETHNHPSAIEPFGGANTGTGGVIRDILGVSAKPIAATDVLCFGPQELDLSKDGNDGKPTLPEGVLHPQRIQSGVVAGVQDYGNKIGIPTVNGAVLYDPGYTANPLVFCGCVGIAPKGRHVRHPETGDHVIVLGGRTGRDGLRGATFSSMTMDAQTGEVAGASVQIGNPITEKGLIEVIVRARDQRLYHAITDCGAGGLSSAVGEMARQTEASTGPGTGAEIELSRVRLKYPGLAPWEIWLSEAQERMVLAVPPAALPALQRLCVTFDVELTDIGEFTDTGRIVVKHDGQVVLDLMGDFLHEGIPQQFLAARLPSRENQPVRATAIIPRKPYPQDEPENIETFPGNILLLEKLSQANIASKEAIIRLYDHEVQGGTVVKPLAGVMNDGPSDGCVLKPIGTSGPRGIALANGINPEFGKLDPYRMALSVVDEAIRNAVAVGANPEHLALLDNFCWGNPRHPDTLGALVEACRGCYEAARHYRTPFISGKDSLNNEYLGTDGQRHAIPPTLLISAIGLVEDVSQVVTLDLKQPGNLVYLLGEIQSSETGVPGMPAYSPRLYRCLHAAIQKGLVRACHDLSEGGLAVAAAEMCLAGRLGLKVELPDGDPDFTSFLEVNACLLVEVRPADRTAFEVLFQGLPWRVIGKVSEQPDLVVAIQNEEFISLPVERLVSAWKRVEART